jgi:hypothetical protein
LLSGPLPIPDDAVRVPDLAHVPGAELESQLNEGKGECHPETRVELLQQIEAWIEDPKGKLIWWLTGKTGTDKSTIARTIALKLRSKKRLGGTFFFTRTHHSCRNASTFVTSLTYQLAKYSSVLAKAMLAAIAKDGDLPKKEKGRSVQWEKLVIEPLSFLDTSSRAIVLVIDALDECDLISDIKSVLQL